MQPDSLNQIKHICTSLFHNLFSKGSFGLSETSYFLDVRVMSLLHPELLLLMFGLQHFDFHLHLEATRNRRWIPPRHKAAEKLSLLAAVVLAG